MGSNLERVGEVVGGHLVYSDLNYSKAQSPDDLCWKDSLAESYKGQVCH